MHRPSAARRRQSRGGGGGGALSGVGSFGFTGTRRSSSAPKPPEPHQRNDTGPVLDFASPVSATAGNEDEPAVLPPRLSRRLSTADSGEYSGNRAPPPSSSLRSATGAQKQTSIQFLDAGSLNPATPGGLSGSDERRNSGSWRIDARPSRSALKSSSRSTVTSSEARRASRVGLPATPDTAEATSREKHVTLSFREDDGPADHTAPSTGGWKAFVEEGAQPAAGDMPRRRSSRAGRLRAPSDSQLSGHQRTASWKPRAASIIEPASFGFGGMSLAEELSRIRAEQRKQRLRPEGDEGDSDSSSTLTSAEEDGMLQSEGTTTSSDNDVVLPEEDNTAAPAPTIDDGDGDGAAEAEPAGQGVDSFSGLQSQVVPDLSASRSPTAVFRQPRSSPTTSGTSRKIVESGGGMVITVTPNMALRNGALASESDDMIGGDPLMPPVAKDASQVVEGSSSPSTGRVTSDAALSESSLAPMQPAAAAGDEGLDAPARRHRRRPSSKKRRKHSPSSHIVPLSTADGVAANPYGVAIDDGANDDAAAAGHSVPAHFSRADNAGAGDDSDDFEQQEMARVHASGRRQSRMLNRRRSSTGLGLPGLTPQGMRADGDDGSPAGPSPNLRARRQSINFASPQEHMGRQSEWANRSGGGGGRGHHLSRSSSAGIALAEKLVRNPKLSVKAQFETWSRGGKRRITLADDIGDAFAVEAHKLDNALTTDSSMSLTTTPMSSKPTTPRGGLSGATPHGVFGSNGDGSESLQSSFAVTGVTPPRALTGLDGAPAAAGEARSEDDTLPPTTEQSARLQQSNAREAGDLMSSNNLVARESAFRRRRSMKEGEEEGLNARELRMMKSISAQSDSSSDTDDHDLERRHKNDEEKKEARRTRKWRKPMTKLNEIEMQLYEASSVKLTVSMFIARIRQEVDEMDTLQDCGIFIPFLGLFLASFLLSVDITKTHFVVNSIRGVDTDGQYEYSMAADAAMRKNLLRGEPLNISVPTQAPGDLPAFNASLNATQPVIGSPDTAPQDSAWSWAQLDWDNLPGARLLRDLNLLSPIYAQSDPVIASKILDPIIPGLDPSFLDIKSSRDFAAFFREVFIPNNWPCASDTRQHSDSTPSRLGSTLLLGAARLRMLRVRPDSCRMSDRVLSRGNATDDEISLFAEDLELERQYELFYRKSLEDQAKDELRCFGVWDSDDAETRPFCNVRNPATVNSTLYEYRECTAAVFDEMERSRYSCDGYVVDLPFNASCESMYELTDIIFPQMTEQQHDMVSTLNEELDSDRNTAPQAPDAAACDSFVSHEATRFVALEYMMVSKPTETFHRVSFLLEVTVGGSWTPLYVSRVFEVWNASTFVLRTVFDVILALGAFFLFGKFFRDWKQFRWRTGKWLAFLFDLWNILEIANLITFMVTLSLRWAWRGVSGGVDVNKIENGVFPESLDTVALLYNSSRFANAVNIVLSFMKVLKYVKMNERMGILTRTLAATQSHIMSLLMLFAFLTCGFAISGVLLYGMFLDRYRNVNTAFSTLFFMLLGEFDYPAMRAVQPLLTFSYFLSFVIIGLFLLLNFIIVILSEGFADEQQNMNTLPLADSILRLFTTIRMILRPAYLAEFFRRRFYERSRLDYMKQASDTLERHYRLVIGALLQGSVSAPEPVMDFQDLKWWLPHEVYDGLGELFLLTLWEDCVFQERWQASSDQNHDREVLRHIITHTINLIVGGCIAEIDLLDAQADRIDDVFAELIHKLPKLETYLEMKSRIEALRARQAAEEAARKKKLQAAMNPTKRRDSDEARFGPITLQQVDEDGNMIVPKMDGDSSSSVAETSAEAAKSADLIVTRSRDRGQPSSASPLKRTGAPAFRSVGFAEPTVADVPEQHADDDDNDAPADPLRRPRGAAFVSPFSEDQGSDVDDYGDAPLPAAAGGFQFQATGAFGGDSPADENADDEELDMGFEDPAAAAAGAGGGFNAVFGFGGDGDDDDAPPSGGQQTWRAFEL